MKRFLLLLFTIQLVSCHNELDMKYEKFEWEAIKTAAQGYPIEVIDGQFFDTLTGEGQGLATQVTCGGRPWQDYAGGGWGEAKKYLPNRLHVTWMDFVENCTYQLATDIDGNKIYQLFKEGFYMASAMLEVNPRKERYKGISVGFVPGGGVFVFVEGFGQIIEIGRYQGKKIEIPKEKIAQLDTPEQTMFSEQYRLDILNSCANAKKWREANKDKPTPYGLWEKYSESKYHWEVVFDLPQGEEFKVLNFNCYDRSELYFFNSLLEKYKKVGESQYIQNMKSTLRSIPMQLNFYLSKERSSDDIKGKIFFNETEIFNAFERVFEGVSEGFAQILIRVNKEHSYASICLKGNGKEVWIMDSKIEFTEIEGGI